MRNNGIMHHSKWITTKHWFEHFFPLQVHDRELAIAVLTSVYRHMWYLSEELVVLALADNGCDDDVKSRMAARLLACGQPRRFAPGKPVMKMDLLQNKQADTPQLYQFIGRRSWLIFHLLELESAWLALPVNEWQADVGYMRFKQYVSNINVVNDAAERAVKYVSDFANHSQDPEWRDEAVQVVNSQRELIDFHNLTKEEQARI